MAKLAHDLDAEIDNATLQWSAVVRSMTAFGGKADLAIALRNVRLWP